MPYSAYISGAFIKGKKEDLDTLIKKITKEPESTQEDSFFKTVEKTFTDLLKLSSNESTSFSHLFLEFLSTPNFQKFLPNINNYINKEKILSYITVNVIMKKYSIAEKLINIIYGENKPNIEEHLTYSISQASKHMQFLIKNYDGWNGLKGLNFLLSNEDQLNQEIFNLLKEKKLNLKSSEYESFINSLLHKLPYKTSIPFVENVFYLDYINYRILNNFNTSLENKTFLMSDLSTKPGSFLDFISKKDNLLNFYKSSPEKFFEVFSKNHILLENGTIDVNEFLDVFLSVEQIISEQPNQFLEKNISSYTDLITKLYSNNKIKDLNFSQNPKLLAFVANYFNPKVQDLSKDQSEAYKLLNLNLDYHHPFKYNGKTITLNDYLVEQKNLTYILYSIKEKKDIFSSKDLEAIFKDESNSQLSKRHYNNFIDKNLINVYYSIVTKGLTDAEIFRKFFIQCNCDPSKLIGFLNDSCAQIFSASTHEFKIDLREYHPYVEFLDFNKKDKNFDNNLYRLIKFLDSKLVANPIFEEKNGFIHIHHNLVDYLNKFINEYCIAPYDSLHIAGKEIEYAKKNKENEYIIKEPEVKKTGKGIFGRFFGNKKSSLDKAEDLFMNAKILRPIILHKNSSNKQVTIVYDNEMNIENEVNNLQKISHGINEDFQELLSLSHSNIEKFHSFLEKNENINLEIKIRAESLLFKNLNFLNKIKENQNLVNFGDVLFLKNNTTKYLFKCLETYAESIKQIKTSKSNANESFFHNIEKEAFKQISLLEKELDLVHQHIKDQLDDELLTKMAVQTKVLEGRQQHNSYSNQNNELEMESSSPSPRF